MATSFAYLVTVQKILTRYGMSTYVALGNLGNLLAIAVFIQYEQRKNACSLYLLTMVVFNICCLNVGVVPIIYALDYYDITTATLLGCQMQFYFRHVFFQMLRTAKALACMDRYAICSTNAHFRAFSNPKMAIYVIIGCIIFWSLVAIFFSWIRSVQNNSCNVFNETYAMIYTIYYMMVSGVFPPLLMTIFSILVMKNLRSLRSRIQPEKRDKEEIHPPIRRIRKRDRDLMKMIFIEVMFYVITTLPFSVYLVYKTRDGTQTRLSHGVTDLDNKTPVEFSAIGCYEKPTIDSEKQENDDDKSPSMKNTESKTNTTIPYELQRRNQPSITGYILLVWITTLLYQAMRHLFSLEAQTTCNAIVQYFDVFWNKLDVLAIILFCVSFILRCIPLTECFYAACIVWPIDIIIWFIRSLDIFVAIKRLGPKLVMIGEM
ncbi:unnamed protein product, partial [Rotaria sp. Silwood1]